MAYGLENVACDEDAHGHVVSRQVVLDLASLNHILDDRMEEVDVACVPDDQYQIHDRTVACDEGGD